MGFTNSRKSTPIFLRLRGFFLGLPGKVFSWPGRFFQPPVPKYEGAAAKVRGRRRQSGGGGLGEPRRTAGYQICRTPTTNPADQLATCMAEPTFETRLHQKCTTIQGGPIFRAREKCCSVALFGFLLSCATSIAPRRVARHLRKRGSKSAKLNFRGTLKI